ncbi:hypothetical protein [Cellulomonas sp. NS3]|uniref:hypothetical protein n=1 Tax=Cellulomonas sp. NS3 TaxID=2973977 RepID=UPI002163602E|nr:hypothetical protein [Cellulomonas sp. NS3]
MTDATPAGASGLPPAGPVAGTPAPHPPTSWSRRLGSLREAALELVSVVVTAARLWWGYWPLLLTIALLGGAARMASLWAATTVSGWNNTLGVAVLMLAPLSSVASIVLMLYALRGALPGLAAAAATSAPVDASTHRERRLIDLLASVLVPFLAVYASYGLLKQDTSRYVNTIVGKEWVENADFLYGGDGVDADRAFVGSGAFAVGIVLAAMVLRWGLARLEGRVHATPLGYVGAYVEVFWMATLARYLAGYKETAWAWVEGRRAIDLVTTWWLDVLDLLGPVARPVDAAVAWAAGVLGSFDDLVVVPLAWLTVGAIVFGHKLVPPPAPARRGVRALEALPGPVRRWGGELVGQVLGDVRGRFQGLVGGLRTLALAGLGPMLVFGLAFLASTRLEEGLHLVVRALVGPQETTTWLAFSPHVGTVVRAVGLTVTMALLAAAVDRMLRSTRRVDLTKRPRGQSTASAT